MLSYRDIKLFICIKLLSNLNNYKYFPEQHKGSMNPETTLALLQTAACETEEESDVSSNIIQINKKIYIFVTVILNGFLEIG